MSKNSEQRAHNKGQRDKAEGRGYNRPNNALGGVFNTKAEDRENVAYQKGFRNAKNIK